MDIIRFQSDCFFLCHQLNSGSKLHGKVGITKEWSLKICKIDEKRLPLHCHIYL